MSSKIKITKLDAARRQLETAVTLWFHSSDPVSIHTLTAAGHRVVLDLLEHQGKSTFLFNMKYVRPGKEKEIKRLIRRSETFFKHAKDDPENVHEFNPDETKFDLLAAIYGYKELDHQQLPLLELFLTYFALMNPEVFSEPFLPQLTTASYIQKLLEGPRKKFFDELLPSFVRACVG
jgi:hypothetical protein